MHNFEVAVYDAVPFSVVFRTLQVNSVLVVTALGAGSLCGAEPWLAAAEAEGGLGARLLSSRDLHGGSVQGVWNLEPFCRSAVKALRTSFDFEVGVRSPWLRQALDGRWVDNCQWNVGVLGESTEVFELLGRAHPGDPDGVKGIKLLICALAVGLESVAVKVTLINPSVSLPEIDSASGAGKRGHLAGLN